MERTGRIADAPAGATPRGAGVPDLSHLEPAHRDRLAARHGAAVASMTPFSRLPGERGTFDAGSELFPRKDPPSDRWQSDARNLDGGRRCGERRDQRDL